MTFQLAAKEIIKKSIRSAICIDDMFEQPYMTEDSIREINKALSKRDGKEKALKKDTPAKLYKSFREIGECDLDIYNFTTIENSWHPQYMLNNKDLIVIDWELEGKGQFESTISILKHAIETNEFPNIPFIIIYTYMPPEDFKLIIQAIVSNFNPFGIEKEEKLNDFAENILKEFEGFSEEEIEIDAVISWIENLENSFFEYWNQTGSEHRKTILSEICQAFNIQLNIINAKQPKTERKLKNILFNTFNCTLEKGIEILFYLSCESKNKVKYYFDRIGASDVGMKINSSIITIFSKDEGAGNGVKPEEVFNSFSDLICNDPHNFLTLLSIEMKDKLRDDSYKIGNNISALDERAFFHHMNTYKKRSSNYENEFFDFLLKCWTNELESYNYNNPPSIFNKLEEYASNRDYNSLVGNDIKKEIGELGLKLSTVRINNRLQISSSLMFGDILRIKRPYQGLTDEYLICITPACVCVDACKVDNNFYFVKSEIVKPFVKSSAAKELETSYYSLIKQDGEVLAVKWECKPFTLHIHTNDLNYMTSFHNYQPIQLEYITTSKENFTQRISNKSFSYGTSIGIDLPNTKNG